MPEIVGEPTVATFNVEADVIDVVGYPDSEPVTRTPICLPACELVNANADPVAPLIAVPDANHWYLRVVPVAHVPDFVLSVDPITGIPLIVGVATRNTLDVAAEVFATVAYPDLVPVTRTVSVLPA